MVEAECGKGTYVRALARDMGRILGCFGHICALRRTLVGPFREADMIPLEQLEALCDRAASGEGSLADALLPVETALDDIPALAVTRADAARLHRGQAVLLRGRDAPNSSGTVYVTVAGRLLALAEIGNGELIPKRVFNLTGLTASPARNNESVWRCRCAPNVKRKSSRLMPTRPATPARPRFRSRSCRNASTPLPGISNPT